MSVMSASACEDSAPDESRPLYVFCGNNIPISGAYRRDPVQLVQGLPVWKRVDGSSIIYSLPSGHWALCENEADIANEKYFAASVVQHGGCLPHVMDLTTWNHQDGTKADLRLRTIDWPTPVHVRCEEKPELCGRYDLDQTETVRGFPLWRQSDGFVICCSKGLRWQITTDDENIQRGRYIITSEAHKLEPPTSLSLYPWKQKRLAMTGTVVSVAEQPELPYRWAEEIWQLHDCVDQSVYVQQRESMKSKLVKLARCVASSQESKAKKIQDCEAKLDNERKRCDSLAAGMVKATFPNTELCIGSTRIAVNREELSKKSPFFATMLRSDVPMQEAASGQVMLPASKVEAVRALLCLMHSNADDAVLEQLGQKLSADQLLDVLAQADEWQCVDVAQRLLVVAKGKLQHAHVSTTLAFLKIASLHVNEADPALQKAWLTILDAASKKLAQSCEGLWDELEHLPFEAMHRVLKQNALDTGGNEARLLITLAKWLNAHGDDHIPALLECVRFPLMRLAALSDDEKTALGTLREKAGSQIQRLIGEAIALQMSRKRKRDRDDSSDEESESSDVALVDDGFVPDVSRQAKKMRSTLREDGVGIPVLSHKEAGLLMCQGLM
eukprot:TRINITY_DN23598_c0_g1_i1.p1 TRINITY_DN23598_c0_g1~~TRINITY_DN23598_c0_g1_i1.p1  ORF type:complete len:613 (-),score=94.70 TRINITY_DN23598_c0_g1_i1:235-2073(-)